jgi:hypothetical protein
MNTSSGPKKSTGEIGVTRITQTSKGTAAELIHTELPANKEDLERYFAERFKERFNADYPMGPDNVIASLTQNDTSDLDFKIDCPLAGYLEVAELNPRSEAFGRAAYRTGTYNSYHYAHWIYFRIIKKKQRAYGAIAKKTLLLLYVTHWQFLPGQRLCECLQSFCLNEGCEFAAVFIFLTDGNNLQVNKKIHPYIGPSLHMPGAYKGFTCTNGAPGNYKLTFNI